MIAPAGTTPPVPGVSGPPMVLAEGLHKSFGRLEVLRGIDLEVARQEVMCIIGPSGSGKSTLLRCINHLEKINAGRLWVNGELVGYRQRGDKLYELREREICAKRAEIGMVFQQFNLFPHMTALENVIEAPIRVKGVSKAKATELAGQLLDRAGLKDKADAYPKQLSGGQQQRVAIARRAPWSRPAAGARCSATPSTRGPAHSCPGCSEGSWAPTGPWVRWRTGPLPFFVSAEGSAPYRGPNPRRWARNLRYRRPRPFPAIDPEPQHPARRAWSCPRTSSRRRCALARRTGWRYAAGGGPARTHLAVISGTFA